MLGSRRGGSVRKLPSEGELQVAKERQFRIRMMRAETRRAIFKGRRTGASSNANMKGRKKQTTSSQLHELRLKNLITSSVCLLGWFFSL